MEISLQGKTVLVTGASRGIGAAIAKSFAEAGAQVMLSSRKEESLRAVAKHIDGETDVFAANTGDIEQGQACVDATIKRFGKIDILVNNAGAAWGAAFDEYPESGWDKTVDLNLKTPFFLTQALAPQLRAAAANNGHLAKVINIASIDGLSINMEETYPYAGSKAGLIHMTKRMALRLIKDGIVVSAIAPGAFASEMNRVARDHGDAIAPGIPSGRIGTPEDMAGAAVYLASRAGDYVVGSTIVVDGGVTYSR